MIAIATPAEAERCREDAMAACAIPAPTGSEAARSAWLAAELEAAGLEPEIDAIGNVTARLGGPGPAVTLAAHLDTVFDDTEPIAVTRAGTVLSGPGISDNSLGLAGLLFMARRTVAHGWAERRPLLLAATVGEEGLGNLRGAKALLDRADCAEFLALEGGIRDEIVTRGVGSRRFEVVASAPGGHSWADRGKPSAVHELVALLGDVLQSTPAAAANVGTIAGGTAVNALAADACAVVEFRDLDNGRIDEAAALLRRRAEQGSAQVSVIDIGARPAGETPQSHPLVTSVLAARRAAGLPQARFTEASTDANAAFARGIPAVAVGLGEGVAPHTRAEHVETTGLDLALTALATLLDDRTRRPG